MKTILIEDIPESHGPRGSRGIELYPWSKWKQVQSGRAVEITAFLVKHGKDPRVWRMHNYIGLRNAGLRVIGRGERVWLVQVDQ